MRDLLHMYNDSILSRIFNIDENIEAFQNGGTMNVIPEGALHARKHHMADDEHITKKGIPVVDNEGTFAPWFARTDFASPQRTRS